MCNRRRTVVSIYLLWPLLALAQTTAQACSIPVFRYALERWPAAPYEAVVFHRGPLTPDQAAVVEWLRKAASADGGHANLDLQTVDLASENDEALAKLWQAEGTVDLPRLVLRYPGELRIAEKAWAGPLTLDRATALVDSPVRRKIAGQLLAGASAVWLLVESGDKAKDDAAAKLLDVESRKLEQTLELPTPMGTDPDAPDGDGATPPMSSAGPKLRIAFPLVRVSRTDAAESQFVGILLGIDADLKKEARPMAFAIFGQGRALPPLIGDGIDAGNIGEFCSFAVGACSCQVKAMNPGFDLLMSADWMAVFDGRAPQEAEMELRSPIAESRVQAGVEPPAPEPHAPAQSGGGPLVRNLLLAVALGVALLAIGSYFVLRPRRASRRQA